MQPFPVPSNEADRLAALEEYQLVDTPPEQEYDDIVQLAAEITDTPMSSITLLDVDKTWYKAKTGIDLLSSPRETTLCSLSIKGNKPLIIPDTLKYPLSKQLNANTLASNIRFYTGIPLTNPEGLTLGALCVLDTQPRQLDKRQLNALNILARCTLTLFELRRNLVRQQQQNQALKNSQLTINQLNEELHVQSITDELTGLLNRRAFNREIEREFTAFKRNQLPLSLLMLDADNFKIYNDRNGHLVGDKALKVLGEFFLENIREVDIAARYGGEEFVIIMPNTAIDKAKDIAERIRAKIETHTSIPKLTISVGISCTSSSAVTDKVSLLSQADQALYRSKENGRNRVTLASESQPEADDNLSSFEKRGDFR